MLKNPKDINKEELKRLKKDNIKSIELDVQTSNDYSLRKCKKNYNFEDIKRASKLVKRYGFELGYQIVIGLPESTKLDELNTARDLAKLKPKTIRMSPFVVTKNSEILEEYEELNLLTVGQAVERCKEIYYYFMKKKINNIYINYQNTEKAEIIDGPYHQVFDKLVEDSIWYDNIVEKIKKFNVKVKLVEIIVNPKNTNNVKGYDNENIEKLRDVYEVEVEISENEKMPKEKFEINILKTYTDFLEESNV